MSGRLNALSLFALPLALVLAASAAYGREAASSAPAGAEQGPRVETVTAAELRALLKDGKAILIDVRTPAEFAEARLAGALNAPLSTFDPAAIPMVEGRETILMCRSSRRSAVAADKLSQHINGRVRHLEGGLLAWQQANLPTEAEPAPTK